MSVRNLDKLFKPRSVAVIGASPRPDSVGGVVATCAAPDLAAS
jgi:acetyltransferase